MRSAESVPLQNFCRIVQGGRLGLSGNDFVPRGFPAYGAGGVNGYLATHEFDEPAVVLSAIGARCGKCFFADGKWISLANTQLIFPDPTRADCKFLWYQLNDERRWHRSGTGQPFIKPSDVKAHRVFLPPLPEQRRIAEILDKADALRAKRRAALAQLDTLTQSIFLDMFGDPATNPKGWPDSSLGTMLFDVTNGMTRRRSESDEGQSIVLRLRDIREGWIDFSDVNRITLTAVEARKYEVTVGDLLFIRVNGNPDYVGRCALFDGFAEKVYFNDHVMRVRVDPSTVAGVFLTFLLNGSHGKREIAKHRKTSAGQHTINQEGLGKIRLPVPPLPLQMEFGTRISAIEKAKKDHAASLSTLDALFAALQHRAFQGEL
jgi:restriction endonuclease S subunit